MKLPDHAQFSEPQRQQLNSVLPTLSPEQATWLSGYLAGIAQPSGISAGGESAAATSSGPIPLSIIFGSESGNAEGLADQTKRLADKEGFKAKVYDMADLKAADLEKHENALVIVSTWGDGDAPERAVTFHADVMSAAAPKLKRLRYSICALGDTSYEQFCKTGKDFDDRLTELGGTRVFNRVDCDVDYEPPYETWVKGAFAALKEAVGAGTDVTTTRLEIAEAKPSVEYGKKNPFPAPLSDRILLNGRGSKKETIHLELSLEGSGLSYEVGDALAVVPQNCQKVVEDVLSAGKFDPQESVIMPDKTAAPLSEALKLGYDITGLTKNILKKYNEVAQSKALTAMLASKDKLAEYTHGREIVDLLTDYPIRGLKATDFVGLLRKLPPRLYSIASSPKAHPGEVHLTVGVVRYDSHGRLRQGVCSSYCADRVGIGETIPVYTHHNKNFRLPESTDTPIIMVGPGTGIAPFRAFIEERAAIGAKGQNWLFFGDQHFNTDFLYQLELEGFRKDGILNRLDVAFSRDTKQKVYVQHRMLEQSKDIYAWMQEGAYFYVCGDASKMAHDVNEALVNIYEKEGGLAREQAEAAVKELQKNRRYQRDVY